jgi:hypothetical protein
VVFTSQTIASLEYGDFREPEELRAMAAAIRGHAFEEVGVALVKYEAEHCCAGHA